MFWRPYQPTNITPSYPDNNKHTDPKCASSLSFQETASMKDVVLAIRADEAHHRVVNHTLASMKEDEYNPYEPGK